MTHPCQTLDWFGNTVTYTEGQSPQWQPVGVSRTIGHGWTACGGQLAMSGQTGGSGNADWNAHVRFLNLSGGLVRQGPDFPAPNNATTAWSVDASSWTQSERDSVRSITYELAAQGFGTRSATFQLNVITFTGVCSDDVTDCCAELNAKLDQVLAAVRQVYRNAP